MSTKVNSVDQQKLDV